MDRAMRRFLLFLLILCCFPAVIAIAAPQEGAPQLIQVLGCKGCHTIDGAGGSLAVDLTQIGSRMTEKQIAAQLTADPASRKGAFMPGYQTLSKADLDKISAYLYHLK